MNKKDLALNKTRSSKKVSLLNDLRVILSHDGLRSVWTYRDNGDWHMKLGFKV